MKNLAFIHDKFVVSLFNTLNVAKRLKTRVATLPDLITIRANNSEDSLAWNLWFTPLSTIYFGVHQGKKVIVVAHHLGPLTTKKRIIEWGKSGMKKDRGGRQKYGHEGLPKITPQEFIDLINGKYGEVNVLDLDNYRQNSWSGIICGEHIYKVDALSDPLLRVLLGPDTEKFVNKHFQISSAFALANKRAKGAKHLILRLEIKDHYGWNLFFRKDAPFPDKQNPVGLFLTLGNPNYWGNHDLSVSTDIYSHDDLGLGRFVVLNDAGSDIVDVRYKPAEHWRECLVKTDKSSPDFFVLIEKTSKYFTEYPKNGHCMDTGEIMHEVIEIEKIGDPTKFKTLLYGSPFLKYHIDEVRAIAPKGANAYQICGDVMPGEPAIVPVRFFRIKANTKKRVLRENEIMNNLPLLLRLNNVATE